MKYRAGDKVKVRSDLKCEEYYGGVPFTSEMNKFKGMEFTIARVNNGGDYKVLETPYTFANEMLEPVEEMSEEEMVGESEDEAQERVLKKYCEDHKGKFYAVAERICRVKE
nr:MAG TPA: Mind bomb SH3 repeat domain [Bacteriophage sp.]